MCLCGRCICSGSGGRRSGVRMKNVTRIDETGWYETLVTIAMSEHPEPIRIVAIQHGHEFASLDADVVLVPRHEGVKNDVSSG